MSTLPPTPPPQTRSFGPYFSTPIFERVGPVEYAVWLVGLVTLSGGTGCLLAETFMRLNGTKHYPNK